MKHEIINRIIQEVGGKHYLEIGYGNGANYNIIQCENKFSCDPNFIEREQIKIGNNDAFVSVPVKVDSDAFFALNETGSKTNYDVVFIDGLHYAEQVRKDIINAMKCNAKAIILHDTIPHSKEMQEVPRRSKQWTGDCWRAAIGFIQSYPDVNVVTYRADFGLTVIYPEGKKVKKHFENKEMTYDEFKANEVELLNIID